MLLRCCVAALQEVLNGTVAPYVHPDDIEAAWWAALLRQPSYSAAIGLVIAVALGTGAGASTGAGAGQRSDDPSGGLQVQAQLMAAVPVVGALLAMAAWRLLDASGVEPVVNAGYRHAVSFDVAVTVVAVAAAAWLRQTLVVASPTTASGDESSNKQKTLTPEPEQQHEAEAEVEGGLVAQVCSCVSRWLSALMARIERAAMTTSAVPVLGLLVERLLGCPCGPAG